MSSSAPHSDPPHGNELLAALPDSDWQRWLPQLEFVELALGQVLYESGSAMSHVYFPTTAIVSLLYVMEDGASAEIAVVGNEGIVGIALFMGGESTPNRAVVQSAGRGLRLNARAIKEEFNRAPVLHLLLRYTQALITQMSQTAVCNRHHSLDQQLCRWLLLSLDRLQGNELVMTQELIANMLGVRREGVTEAALKLQKAGLIRYARGRISVLDRAGLEQRSCECYAVVKNEYDGCCPPSRQREQTAFVDRFGTHCPRCVRWHTAPHRPTVDTRGVTPAENHLIGSLPPDERARLLSVCEPVELALSSVVSEPGEPARHVYFPIDSFISLVRPVDEHVCLEVGMVGREGMLGVHVALGIAISPLRAVVQGAGLSRRVGVAAFSQQLALNPALQRGVGRYLYVLMAQQTTSIACARFHTIKPRLARWLLMTQDRSHADAFRVTQEFLGYMLGVRRVGVTVAASLLQRSGLITYRRGVLGVLDRAGLEAAACSCYRADQQAYDALL